MFPYPYGDTVTLVRRTLSGRDADNNDVYTDSSEAIAGVPVWPGGEGSGITGSEQTQGRETVTTGISFLLPADTDLSAVDGVRYHGLDYEISGDPARYVHPNTGRAFVYVRATRVTG